MDVRWKIESKVVGRQTEASQVFMVIPSHHAPKVDNHQADFASHPRSPPIKEIPPRLSRPTRQTRNLGFKIQGFSYYTSPAGGCQCQAGCNPSHPCSVQHPPHRFLVRQKRVSRTAMRRV